MTQRILASDKAKALIDELKAEHGDIIFHQSGGCCDGSSPMSFPKGELMINETDVWLGNVHSCDFYMAKDQFEYWQHTQLLLDVVPGRGASFSLEIPKGVRFVIKSRLFSEGEEKNLVPIRYGE